MKVCVISGRFIKMRGVFSRLIFVQLTLLSICTGVAENHFSVGSGGFSASADTVRSGGSIAEIGVQLYASLQVQGFRSHTPFCSSLDEVAFNAPPSKDLLPLFLPPPSLLGGACFSKCDAVTQRRVGQEAWVHLILHGINWLYSPLGQFPAAPRSVLSDPQRALIARLNKVALEFISGDDPLQAHSEIASFLDGSLRADYSSGFFTRASSLIEKLVDFPQEAGVVDPLPLLHTAVLRELYVNPDSCMLPRCEWPVKVPRHSVRAEEGEWEGIVTRGYKSGVFCGLDISEVFSVSPRDGG